MKKLYLQQIISISWTKKKITEGLIEIVSLSDINCTDDIEETADTLEGKCFAGKQGILKRSSVLIVLPMIRALKVEVLEQCSGCLSGSLCRSGTRF